MLDGRNSHNLTLLLLGVKAREIRWKKYKWKINNNWQCLMEEIHNNLTLLLLGVKAREIRWKKYKGKINNNWQCLMEEIHTI